MLFAFTPWNSKSWSHDPAWLEIRYLAFLTMRTVYFHREVCDECLLFSIFVFIFPNCHYFVSLCLTVHVSLCFRSVFVFLLWLSGCFVVYSCFVRVLCLCVFVRGYACRFVDFIDVRLVSLSLFMLSSCLLLASFRNSMFVVFSVNLCHGVLWLCFWLRLGVLLNKFKFK